MKKYVCTVCVYIHEGLDAIHDTVHEMCKDETRHGRAFKGLLDRHFSK